MAATVSANLIHYATDGLNKVFQHEQRKMLEIKNARAALEVELRRKAEMKKRIVEVRKRDQEKTELLEQVTRNNDRAYENLESRSRSLPVLVAEIDELSKEINTRTQDVKRAEEKTAANKESREIITNRMENDQSVAEEEMKTHLDALKVLKDQFTEKKNQAEKSIKDLNDKILELAEENGKIMEENGKSTAETEIKNRELENLKSNSNTLLNNLKQLESRQETLEKEIISLEEELATKQAKVEELSAENLTMEKNIQNCQNQIKDLFAEIQKLEAKLRDLSSDWLKKFELIQVEAKLEEIKHVEQQLLEKAAILTDAESQIAKKEEEYHQVHQMKEQMQTKLEEAKDKCSRGIETQRQIKELTYVLNKCEKAQDLQRRLDNVNETLISKGKLNDPKKEVVAKLRNEMSSLKEKLDQLDAPEEATDTDAIVLKSPDECYQEIINHHRDVDNSEAKIKQMEDNLAAKKVSDQKIKNELGRQHIEMIKPMKEKLNSQEKENLKVSKENEDMEKKCDRQSKAIENQKMDKEVTSILNKCSLRASDSTENENTKKMKVQAKTSTTAAPPTKAKSYSQVIEPEATTAAASKKSYKEYKPKCDSHTNIASPGTVAQLFQQLKGKVEKRTAATTASVDPYEDMDSDETPSVRKFFKASKAMTSSQSTTPKRVTFMGIPSPASSSSSIIAPSPASRKSKAAPSAGSVSAAKKSKTSTKTSPAKSSKPSATSGQSFSQPNQNTIKTYERKTKRTSKKLYSSDVLQGLMNESP